MELSEVPVPAINRGQILIRNRYSLISAGTEGKTVSDARKGYIAKAKSRKKEVKMVLDMVKNQGIQSTYKLVMNKLEAPSPLGYSCAGEVIAVAEDIKDLKPGDLVACGGQGAYHADFVAVYRNLCVKLPEDINLQHAAFTTVASIALQGIRQAEIQLGANCVVIGLGLIGQLTMQLLRASGIKPIGIDIGQAQVDSVKKQNNLIAFNRNQKGLNQLILDATGGYGTDAVIITAGTTSLDPVELAGELCRQKGKVVIVGAVPTGFSRTNYYKKELDLRMSSSYGPGRYDPSYEEKGIDYPIGYVRWTENRNMQTFVNLLAGNHLNIDHLISHVFDLPQAPDAYSMILERSEPFSGILIKYDENDEIIRKVTLGEVTTKPTHPNIGFIGAGNFTQNILLPRLKGLVTFVGVATARGNTSSYVGKKYGFAFCTSDSDEILRDNRINTVFITTRHHLHAPLVIEALKAGKNVFVEKPLALTMEELESIRETYLLLKQKPMIMVGYNRRFAPFSKKIATAFLPNQPRGITMRINAGNLPPNHWVHDSEVGGGRIIGEACHFIDLAIFYASSSVVSISAVELKNPNGLQDSTIINLKFQNGSVASIAYLSNGNKQVMKENIEIYCDGTIAQIDDFAKYQFFGKQANKSKISQDKGHEQELVEFCKAISEGKPSPISFEELYHSSLVTFKAIEAMQRGQTLAINHSF